MLFGQNPFKVLKDQTEHLVGSTAEKYLMKEEPGGGQRGFAAGGRPRRRNAGIQTHNSSEKNESTLAYSGGKKASGHENKKKTKRMSHLLDFSFDCVRALRCLGVSERFTKRL